MNAKNLTTADKRFISETAKTIYQQVRYPNAYVFYSWGGHAFGAVCHDGMAALTFKVSGFLHKGRVTIAYDEGADAYVVYIINNDGTIKSKIEDVYCFELQQVIDRQVETANDKSEGYSQQVDEFLKSC